MAQICRQLWLKTQAAHIAITITTGAMVAGKPT
jgi:hypothetical protein